MLLGVLGGGAARADSAVTRDALDRLEELLEVRVQDGRLPREDMMPAMLVSARARSAEDQAWFTAGAIEALEGSLGVGGLRLCEACMVPRVQAVSGALSWQAGPVSLDEVRQLDEQTRGAAPPARTAIWLDEHPGGVSVRVVDLASGRVLFARNVDPALVEGRNTARVYTLSEELERRARGDSLTQSFFDVALYPSQHVSLDLTDQWGATNRNLTGVTASLFDPILGLGVAHYRATRLYNTTLGGKVIFSLPTAAVSAVSEDIVGEEGVLDPLLTGVAVVRVPIARSNYGVVLTASTNGRVAVGVSMMNFRFLPVLP